MAIKIIFEAQRRLRAKRRCDNGNIWGCRKSNDTKYKKRLMYRHRL